MIQIFRHKQFVKSILWLLCLQFFNLSIDTRDVQANHQVEDLSINDQESIIELVVEKVFGWEKAFTEVDDQDHEKNTKPKLEKVVSFHQLICIQKLSVEIDFITEESTYPIPSLTNGFHQKIIQPPQKDLA